MVASKLMTGSFVGSCVHHECNGKSLIIALQFFSIDLVHFFKLRQLLSKHLTH